MFHWPSQPAIVISTPHAEHAEVSWSAGMVLFMQVVSWYFVYFLIGLLAYPLFVIVVLGFYLILFVFLTASTALLLLLCVTRCRRCPQQCVPIMNLVTIGLICSGFTYILSHVVEGKWTTSYNSNQIVSVCHICLWNTGIAVLHTQISAFSEHVDKG